MPVGGFGRDQKLSLLLNAYNAFTLRLILDHYPCYSLRHSALSRASSRRSGCVRARPRKAFAQSRSVLVLAGFRAGAVVHTRLLDIEATHAPLGFL